MRLKHFALGTLLTVTGIAATASHATPITVQLKLESVSSTSVSIPNPNTTAGGTVNASIYPYNFSINGSSTYVSLMCISMNDEVTIDESWTATESTLSTSSSTQDIEEAWLVENEKSYSPTAVQLVAWDIFDSAASSSSAWTSSGAGSLLTTLDDAMASPSASFMNNANLSQFTLFAPSGTYAEGKTPQTFIGESSSPTSVTPEPSSLLLLGSGLLAIGTVLMRRRNISLGSEA